MTNNESVFRVCGLLLLAALMLSACGGVPQRDDAQLAALNQRVELLTLFVACDDESKLQQFSETAPELGLKAKCDAWRTKQVESQASVERNRRELEQRADAFRERAAAEEPPEEPWASEAEAELKAFFEKPRNIEESPYKIPEQLNCEPLPMPYIRCGTVMCWAKYSFSEPNSQECFFGAMMGFALESELFENGHSGRGTETGVELGFTRKGYQESDLLTLGWEGVLADEPRDEVWAPEAEKNLVATAQRNAPYYSDKACGLENVPECRNVTCRISLPAGVESDCINVYRDAWPSSHALVATSRSPDGRSRTYYLVREGFTIADAMVLK